MLTGKKLPQNIRAMHLVAEEILRSVVHVQILCSKYDLMKILAVAEQSLTAKLWVDVFIKPVFIMMMFS